MSVLKESSTKTLLDFITATVTANSEDDVSYLLKLLEPTDDRDEMGTVYTDLLGYNPITFFDEKYLHKIYAEIADRAPLDIRRILQDKENHFIDETMAALDETRDDYLFQKLASIIAEETGWMDEQYRVEDEEKRSTEFEIDEEDETLDDELVEEDETLDDDEEYAGGDD